MFSTLTKSFTSTLAGLEDDISRSLSSPDSKSKSTPQPSTPDDAPAELGFRTSTRSQHSLETDASSIDSRSLHDDDGAMKELVQLRQAFSELQDAYYTLQSEKASVGGSDEQSGDVVEELKQQIVATKRETARRIDELNSANQSLEKKLETVRVKAKEKITQLQQQLEAKQSSNNTSNDAQRVSELEEELQTVREQLVHSEQSGKEVQSMLLERDAEIARLKQKLSQQESSTNPQHLADTWDNNWNDNQSQHGSTQPSQEVQNILEELKTERSRFEQLEESYSIVQHQVDELEEKAKASDEKIASLTTLNERLKNKLREISEDKETALKRVSELQAQVQRPQVDQALTEQLAELKRQNDTLKLQLEEAHGKMTSLNQAVEAAAAAAVPSISEVDLKTELAEAKKKIQALEDLNFSSDEQIKDLKIQVSQRQLEMTRLQDALKQRANQSDQSVAKSDEKINKMRGLLASANKALAEKKEQIVLLSSQLDEARANTGALADERNKQMQLVNEAREQLEQMKEEMLQSMSASTAQIQLLEKRAKTAEGELRDVKAEYEQHKARAKKVLSERNIESYQAKITELEAQLATVRKENNALLISLETTRASLEQATADLQVANERRRDVENQLLPLKDRAEQVMRWREESVRLTEKVESMEKATREERKQLQQKHMAEIKVLREELSNSQAEYEAQLRKKDQELEAMQLRAMSLSSQLSTIRDELVLAQQEKSSEHATSTTPSVSVHIPPSESPSESRTSSSFSGLSDLLGGGNRPAGGPLFSESSSTPVHDLPSEYKARLQHLSELLSEAESNLERMMIQEKALKEEIRRLDGLHGMQDLNVSYVKNVLFKFFETEDRQSLVPVIATMLHLNLEEVKQLREAVAVRPSLARAFGLPF